MRRCRSLQRDVVRVVGRACHRLPLLRLAGDLFFFFFGAAAGRPAVATSATTVVSFVTIHHRQSRWRMKGAQPKCTPPSSSTS